MCVQLARSIACKAHPCISTTTIYNLCLAKQLAIMKADPDLVSKCRHMDKFEIAVEIEVLQEGIINTIF